MIFVLIFAAFVALLAVAAFVWTAVRAGVRQAVDNAGRKHRTEAPAAWFTPVDADAPVNYWPTYTDARATETATRADGRTVPVYHAGPADEDVPEHREAGQEFWPVNDLRRRCY